MTQKFNSHAYTVISCCYSHLSSIASNFRNLKKNQILWYFPWKLCQEPVNFFFFLLIYAASPQHICIKLLENTLRWPSVVMLAVSAGGHLAHPHPIPPASPLQQYYSSGHGVSHWAFLKQEESLQHFSPPRFKVFFLWNTLGKAWCQVRRWIATAGRGGGETVLGLDVCGTTTSLVGFFSMRVRQGEVAVYYFFKNWVSTFLLAWQHLLLSLCRLPIVLVYDVWQITKWIFCLHLSVVTYAQWL